MTDVDEFLAHYGVKGMRWGVRKKRDGGSEGTKKLWVRKDGTNSEKTASETPKKSGSSGSKGAADSGKKGAGDSGKKPKSLADLSTDELKGRVKRLNLEKQYKTLKGAPPEIDGKALTQEILTTVGKQTAVRLGNEVAYAIGKEFTDAFVQKAQQKIRSKFTQRKKEEPKK